MCRRHAGGSQMIATCWNTAYYDPSKPVEVKEKTILGCGEIYAFVYACVIEGDGMAKDIAARIGKSTDHVQEALRILADAGYIGFDWYAGFGNARFKLWKALK